MRVLSWNIRGIKGLGDKRLDDMLQGLGGLGPDVLLLQEVGHAGELPKRLRAGLAALGFSYFHHAAPGHGMLPHAEYGSAIASRWRISDHASTWLVPTQGKGLRSELIARATLHIEGLAVEVISAHMPNGSGNGWTKIEHFEALVRHIERLRDRPVILGGDFNEPRIERPDGRWLCFGESLYGGNVWRPWKHWTHNGVRDTGQRWCSAVRSVLAADNVGGLVDACRAVRGPAAVATTHVAKGQNRFFDHILASRHFTIEDMGFEHAWREAGWSDHSAVWAKLKPAGATER